jgi:hypothetical protein
MYRRPFLLVRGPGVNHRETNSKSLQVATEANAVFARGYLHRRSNLHRPLLTDCVEKVGAPAPTFGPGKTSPLMRSICTAVSCNRAPRLSRWRLPFNSERTASVTNP